MEREPRVTICVLPREGFTYVKESLASLRAATSVAHHLIVVDGGPPWPARRMLERGARRGDFRLVHTQPKLIPNVARNIALREATTEFVAFVDNDLFYKPGWLEALLGCADASGADVVGPLLCQGADGEPLFADVHGGAVMLRFVDDGNRRHFLESLSFHERPLEDAQRSLVAEPADCLEPHCLLVRRSIFDLIGPFDEALQSSMEHLDFALRVRAAGGILYVEPAAVVHYKFPPSLPRGLLSLPFYLARWSDERNHASVRRFREKWMLEEDDPLLMGHIEWLYERRYWIFEKPLRPLRKMGLARFLPPVPYELLNEADRLKRRTASSAAST